MKKLFAVLMSIMMIACFMPTMAFADGNPAGTTSIDISEATLHDTRLESSDAETKAKGIADADLSDTYEVSDDGSTITITVKNLAEHQNGNSPASLGKWVGFVLPKKVVDDNANKQLWYKYNTDDSYKSLTTDQIATELGLTNQKGIAFYFNLAGNQKTSFSYYFGDEDAELTNAKTLNITINKTYAHPDGVIKAPLEDKANPPQTKLFDKYDISYNESTGKATITVKNLKEHTNDENTKCKWVGIAVPVEANVKDEVESDGIIYKLNNGKVYNIDFIHQVGENKNYDERWTNPDDKKQYICFYFDAEQGATLRYAFRNYTQNKRTEFKTVDANVMFEQDASNITFTATDADKGTLSGLVDGGKYTVNGNGFTATGETHEVTGITEGNLIIVKKANAANETDSDAKKITVDQATQPTVTSAACTTADNNDGKLKGVTTGMQYKLADATEWTNISGEAISADDSSITLPAGTYHVRVKASGTTLASTNQEVTIASYSAPALTGTVTIAGTAKFGQTLTASLSEDSNNTGNLTYKWYRSGEDTEIATGTEYTIVKGDIGHTITVKVTSDEQTGERASEATADVTKADTAAPKDFKLTFTLNEDGTSFTATIPKVAGAVYSFDGETYNAENTKNNCEPNKAYTGYVKIAETETHLESAVKSSTQTSPKLKVKTPTFNPNGSTGFRGTQTVTIICEDKDAKIYYTTDGKEPTRDSTEYTAHITLNATTTVKAIAVKEGMDNSDVATATFTKTSSSSGSGGGGGSSVTPATPSQDVKTDTKSGTTTVATDVKVSEKTNADGTKEKVAEVKVSAAKQKEILKQAKAGKSKDIVLSVSKSEVGDAGKADVTLDKSFIESIANDTDAKLTIQTPFGEKTYTKEELKKLAAEATGSTITMTIEPAADDSAAKIEKAKEIVADMQLVARSSKTAKKSVKVVLKTDDATKASIEELKALGFKVEYKFYRSTKKAASYKATVTKENASYTNTVGKKGTKYFYKVRVVVSNGDGVAVQTALKQCKYASRTWTK